MPVLTAMTASGGMQPPDADPRSGSPGLAGRQTRIPLKGEVSDHKGNF
jgi:hypothetical protein